MKIARISALVAAAFLLLAPVAQAQSQAPFLPGYFSFMGGTYVPDGQDLENFDYDAGFVGFLSTGYMANPFLGFQTDIGYLESSNDFNTQVSAIPILVSVKLAIPIAFVEPYLLGGGGVYFANTSYDLFYGGTVDENTTEFGAHAAAGLNFNFDRFQFGIEARYLWLEAAGLDVDGLMVMGKIGTRF